MNDVGPHFEKRLEAAACRLAAAIDIATVLQVRADAMGVMTATKAASAKEPVRRQREMRRRARLIRRAREIRRQAELIAGEMLLSMYEHGLRKEIGFQPRAGTNRQSLADLGFKYWATANRWMARARQARSSGPRPQQVRFQDNADIK